MDPLSFERRTRLQRAVEDITNFSDGFVDIGPSQSVSRYEEQLTNLRGHGGLDPSVSAASVLSRSIGALQRLEIVIRPAILPADYRWFLETFGGLSVSNSDRSFLVRGIGPSAGIKYGELLDDEQSFPAFVGGHILVGYYIVKHRLPSFWSDFMIAMDVSSSPRFGEIVVVRFSNYSDSELEELLLDPLLRHVGQVKPVAQSFTDLLEVVARSRGSLEID